MKLLAAELLQQPPEHTRAAWAALAERLATPVLTAAAAGQLRERMPVEARPGEQAVRARFTHLEALARLLAGVAPWLAAADHPEAERPVVQRLRELFRKALASVLDPASPDALNFGPVDPPAPLASGWQLPAPVDRQPVVDAAFLAQALLRAPALAKDLPEQTRGQLVAALLRTRACKPWFNNWLLFSAMVEAGLHRLGQPFDPMRVDYALRQHMQWYCGDGLYADGPRLHADYYNSYVIHPMLLDLLDQLGSCEPQWSQVQPAVLQRAQRYAVLLERSIAPDGSFPPVGRSITYRTAAFAPLAQLAATNRLPPQLPPGQVRTALTAAIRRCFDPPTTWDPAGWLHIGLAGHQPDLAEVYISTGSLYLASLILQPLALPAAHPFWAEPPSAWTALRLWRGENLPADVALQD